ncbi:MAG: hypothetical protein R3E87_10425 [Burkholderiaceae bacterium]
MDADATARVDSRYWMYQVRSSIDDDREIQAALLSPSTHPAHAGDCGFGFASPLQDEPYGVPLKLLYQVRMSDKHPDFYPDSHGFCLFSERLVNVMRHFEVKAEYFPVRMIDENGDTLPLSYYVFHSLEGVIDVLDPARSEWTGDWRVGVPRVVLKPDGFPQRPIFVCDHLYEPMMRDDLKQSIQGAGITGFGFLNPLRYRCGSHGFPPPYTVDGR